MAVIDPYAELRKTYSGTDGGFPAGHLGINENTSVEVLKKVMKEILQNIYRTPPVHYSVGMFHHDLSHQIPLTPFVQSIVTTKSLDAPYETCTISLKIPLNMIHTLFMDATGLPTTGQYILVKKPRGQIPEYSKPDKTPQFNTITTFFGCIQDIHCGFGVDQVGQIKTATLKLQCGPFIQPMVYGQYKTTVYNLTRQHIQNAPGISEFLIAGEDWRRFMKSEVMSAVRQTNVRDSIKLLLHTLGYMRVPDAILSEPNNIYLLFYKYTQGLISERVIFNALQNNGFDLKDIEEVLGPNGFNDALTQEAAAQARTEDVRGTLRTETGDIRLGSCIDVATAKHHLPPSCILRDFLPEDEPEFADLSRLVTPFQRGGSVWDLLTGTFSHDKALMEMFCVFVPADAELDKSYKPPDPDLYAALGGQLFVIWRLKPLSPDMAINKESMNAAARANNIMIRPGRKQQDIEYSPISETNNKHQDSIPLNNTVYSAYGQLFESADIVNFNWGLSEASRVNGCYVENPNLDTEDLTFTGNVLAAPVIDTFDAVRHGLKMYEVNYPFKDILKQDSTTYAEYLYLLHSASQKYYTGTFEIKNYPEFLFAGTWATINFDFEPFTLKTGSEINIDNLPDDPRTPVRTGPTQGAIQPRIEDRFEEALALETADPVVRRRRFMCYIESIQEITTVAPSNGLVQTTYIVNFTRGSWGGVQQILPPKQIGQLGRL